MNVKKAVSGGGPLLMPLFDCQTHLRLELQQVRAEHSAEQRASHAHTQVAAAVAQPDSARRHHGSCQQTSYM